MSDDHGKFHLVPAKYLIATAIALLLLTIITVAAAKIDFADYQLAELNIIVALAIAVVKASLVCLFFMHLRWDRPFNAIVLVGSIAFVALFIGFSLMDTAEYQNDIVRMQQQPMQPGDEVSLQPDAPKVKDQLRQTIDEFQADTESNGEATDTGAASPETNANSDASNGAADH